MAKTESKTVDKKEKKVSTPKNTTAKTKKNNLNDSENIKVTLDNEGFKYTDNLQKPLTINDIPPELIQQICTLIQSQNQHGDTFDKNQKVVNNVSGGRFTKIDLANRDIQDDLVQVEAVTSDVNFISKKTGTSYEWRSIGDVEIMSIAEIRTMHRQSERFLKTPWLIVHDKRVVEALELENIVDAINKLKDIDSLVQLSESELKSALNILPKMKEFKQTFASDILEYILEGKITDVGVIATLEKVLGVGYKQYL